MELGNYRSHEFLGQAEQAYGNGSRCATGVGSSSGLGLQLHKILSCCEYASFPLDVWTMFPLKGIHMSVLFLNELRELLSGCA